MNIYFGDKFFPKNFILLGSNADELGCKAGDIAAEANKLFPKSFCGDRSVFPFEFRYVPPFEKPYGELKRLQGTIANYAGRRSEYCGYILIDLNSYIKHESENYFDVTIKFLADNNDCWNYIYLASQNDDGIFLIIQSPAGSVSAGLSILDTMNSCKCDICTVVRGRQQVWAHYSLLLVPRVSV